MLVVNIEQIRDRGISLAGDVPVDQLPELGKLDPRDGLFLGPVKVDLRLEVAGGMILLRGHLGAAIEQPCSRCLNDFILTLDVEFSLAFEQRNDENMEVTEEDLELSAEELGVVRFDGDTLNLADAIGEQLMLALPYRPLCSEQCEGLCSRCGADLNQGPCGCQPDDKENPFAVLKNLRID